MTVAQGGRRRVWNDTVDVCRRWDNAGQPGHDRLGLTVTRDGEHTLRVDTPNSRHRWRLR